MNYHFARWILPVDRPPIAHGFIAVEAGRIVAVGSQSELADSLRSKTDPTDSHLLTPGLINTHTHLDQSFGEQVATDGSEKNSMADWLARVVEKNRAAATMTDRLRRCRDGVEEMLASGTTCVNDISADGTSLYALGEAGLRGIVSLEAIHPTREPVLVDDLLARYEALQANCSARIVAGLSPHSPYNVSPEAWQTLLAAYPQVPIHTHVAESAEESAYFRGRPSQINELHRRFLGREFPPEPSGLSPVAYMHNLGLLNERTLVAHAVFTSAEDRAILADTGVSLSHCPRSNRFLHGQTLVWEDWRDNDIPIGLGTDGHLSTPTLDLREEALQAMALHGLDAATALFLMTQGGAAALRMSERLGSLSVGKVADWVRWQPVADDTDLSPEAQVLSAVTHAKEVYVEGELVFQAVGVSV